MTLVQLQHFVALAQAGSFGRAATAIHLTQPALSRSIQGLESALGLVLFDRVGKRAELTVPGRELLERARALLADAHALRGHGRRLAQGDVGPLRVGLGSGSGAMLMGPLLALGAARAPAVQVEVARGATDLLVERLRARSLDALVVDLRSMRPAADLEVHWSGEMRGAFMVAPRHPLARRRACSFEELLQHPLASTPLSDEVARALVERYGAQAHPQAAVSVRCDDLASLVHTTLHSNAVLLAIRAAAPQLRELALKPALALTARFGLVTLAQRVAAPTLPLLQALVKAHLLDDARGAQPAGAGPAAPAPRRLQPGTR